MPKTMEELEKQFNDLQNTLGVKLKEAELKLESAVSEAKQFKEVAQKSEAELLKLKNEQEKQAKEFAEKTAQARKAEISGFVESMVKAGRIIPAMKEAVTMFMESLTSESEIISFTQKSGSKVSHNQLSLFKELISKMKPVIPVSSELTEGSESFREIPDGIEDGERHFTSIHHNGKVVEVEVDEMDTHVKVVEYMESHKGISYADALLAVSPRKKMAKV